MLGILMMRLMLSHSQYALGPQLVNPTGYHWRAWCACSWALGSWSSLFFPGQTQESSKGLFLNNPFISR